MVKKKLNAGIGAECSTLIKYLHPAKRVSEVLVNQPANERLSGLLA